MNVQSIQATMLSIPDNSLFLRIDTSINRRIGNRIFYPLNDECSRPRKWLPLSLAACFRLHIPCDCYIPGLYVVSRDAGHVYKRRREHSFLVAVQATETLLDQVSSPCALSILHSFWQAQLRQLLPFLLLLPRPKVPLSPSTTAPLRLQLVTARLVIISIKMFASLPCPLVTFVSRSRSGLPLRQPSTMAALSTLM